MDCFQAWLFHLCWYRHVLCIFQWLNKKNMEELNMSFDLFIFYVIWNYLYKLNKLILWYHFLFALADTTFILWYHFLFALVDPTKKCVYIIFLQKKICVYFSFLHGWNKTLTNGGWQWINYVTLFFRQKKRNNFLRKTFFEFGFYFGKYLLIFLRTFLSGKKNQMYLCLLILTLVFSQKVV